MLLGYIQLALEVAAFLVSVLFWRALRQRGWHWWIPFLAYNCVVELWGTWLTEVKHDDNNLWLYNPYIIVSTVFFVWFLLHVSPMPLKTKQRLYRLLFGLGTINLAWYLVWGSREDLLSYHLNVGALLICVCCLLFYYTQVKSPLQHRSLTAVPAFWLVSGLLFFYTGISVYVAMYSFLAAANIRIFHVTIQNLIPQALSLLLYSSIIISFLQCRSPYTSL